MPPLVTFLSSIWCGTSLLLLRLCGLDALFTKMTVRVRLQRLGRRNRPFYRVVVADSRAPRNGKFIELVSKDKCKNVRYLVCLSLYGINMQ